MKRAFIPILAFTIAIACATVSSKHQKPVPAAVNKNKPGMPCEPFDIAGEYQCGFDGDMRCRVLVPQADGTGFSHEQAWQLGKCGVVQLKYYLH